MPHQPHQPRAQPSDHVRQPLLQGLRHFLLALQYFTRIPVTGALARWVGYHPQMLRHALGHLPGIGLLIGLLSAAVMLLALAVLPSMQQAPALAWVAALLSTVASLWLTGAFHEDGLADLADGLGGGSDRQRILLIMKDSRIGSFAAVTLIVALLLKTALLAALLQLGPALLAASALPAAHVCSRLMPLLLTAWLPHVGNSAQSKSKPIATGLQASALRTALLWLAVSALAVGALLRSSPVAAPASAWLWAGLGALLGGGLVGWRLRVRLGGFTGDGLGAAQQVGELGFYLALLMALAPRGAALAASAASA
ncbi:adenosylcobinamide-GDP ribazoletransferase [Vandammella animalimorsus]|uniref:adenosylcobinamide-GDP ribazoletransferase n=1 Tax=Vandammella animalimorsus TaxID=2029117 RepID=UPI0026CE9E70